MTARPWPPAGVGPFVPHPRLRNGHLMTLVAWARPRRFPDLPPPEARHFRVSDDTTVLAHCHWQPERRTALTLVSLHGLEGSSDAHYIRGLADRAWRAGFNVVRLNQRNCGGTEHLTPGLYHSGLTADPLAVIRELVATDGLTRVAVAGFSLGGNVTIKLAGELGDTAPPWLEAVAAVSPTIDLQSCIDAIERRSNLIYQMNFVRNLRARMRRKAMHWPDAFDLSGLGRIWTIRAFDEAYTAPSHGFAGAADYYYRASALRDAARIRVPALLIAAEDDPFVPADPFRDPAVTGNASITTAVSPHGGHCGFIGPGGRYWAEDAIVSWLQR